VNSTGEGSDQGPVNVSDHETWIDEDVDRDERVEGVDLQSGGSVLSPEPMKKR
jgi:hypothetical protein